MILLLSVTVEQLHCVMLKPKSWKKIILSNVLSYIDHDKYQFGFKRQHSTTFCAGIVKQSTEYYISGGSHVFVCFVDFCKVFDKVNYWTLLLMMESTDS